MADSHLRTISESAGRAHLPIFARGETLAEKAARHALALLPRAIYRVIAETVRRADTPRVGGVEMGDLARVTPISDTYGFDRGLPIDRWYIERFLAMHAADIAGDVLEVGTADYCERFGGDIRSQSVVDILPDNPNATIVADLCQHGALPEAAFDCEVITQALQYTSDFRPALANLKRALKPGGVLLLTTPGIAWAERDGRWLTWFWSFTEPAVRRLLEAEFEVDQIDIAVCGNVYAATCFLHGLAVEEVDERLLQHVDRACPLVVCARARRDG